MSDSANVRPPPRATRAAHGSPDPEELRAILTDPAVYGRDAGPIEVRETHSSLVFLAGPDVFKAKKPVDLGFLDYSTPRRRALMCRREVTLNRRLAPTVYLGVKRLVRLPDGGWSIRERGRALEYLVHMRRLPDAATLSARIAGGNEPEALVARVAHRLAEFHEAAPQVPDRLGSPSAFLRNARDNIQAIAASSTLGPLAIEAAISSYTERFLRENRKLFTDRIAAGRIRDGHGDLRCEHVYIEDDGTLSVIDCLEFSRAFRSADVALDLAFLFMNLTATGYPDLADLLVEAWQERNGDSIRAVVPFFTCYRAMVRAKVSHIRAGQAPAGSDDRAAALLDAEAHLNLAARIAAGEGRPRLTLIAGLPATGKSTVARIAATLEGATLLIADRVRKEIAGVLPGSRSSAGVDRGLYTPEMNERVYGELRARAAAELSRGRNVVLDATHRRRADRDAAAGIARAAGARFLAVECTAPEEVVRRRMAARREEPDAWSDAGWEIYVAHRESFEPVVEPPGEQRLTVETDRDVEGIGLRLLQVLAAAGESR